MRRAGTALQASYSVAPRMSGSASATGFEGFEGSLRSSLPIDAVDLARLECVAREFREPRDDAFRGHSTRHSICEAAAWRELIAAEDRSTALPKVNETLLRRLKFMGYPELRARKALLACAPKNVWSASEWLEAHKGDADIDAPIRRVPACVEINQ